MTRPKETYNKKQREAKKQQQLKEKKLRAEERKNEKKDNSLENMMAYLDENGNLSSTPPDPLKKKEFALEDIQIGVPKWEEQDGDDSPFEKNGTVSFFNSSKGFGFIQPATGGERVFFHVQNLTQEVKEGEKVKFKIGHGPRGVHATEISKLSS
ncbi:MAG: DNA-binding protein [Citrobacter freundii]|nr:MAG: DNA-binding protein [Citrobacter freundii]